MSDFNKCSDCYVAEQENKHLQAEIKWLRQLVEEAFFEGFGDGVTAGHPMGSRSSDSEAWENSNSKEEVSYEIDSGKPSRATKSASRILVKTGPLEKVKISMQQRKQLEKKREQTNEEE